MIFTSDRGAVIISTKQRGHPLKFRKGKTAEVMVRYKHYWYGWEKPYILLLKAEELSIRYNNVFVKTVSLA